MFFFGAFSGNFIYLILAISYLAGFTTLAFRSPEDQKKAFEVSEAMAAPVLFDNTLHAYSIHYYIINNDHTDQAVPKEVSLQTPVASFSTMQFFPPPLIPKSHFSGSEYFSRPPPFILV